MYPPVQVVKRREAVKEKADERRHMFHNSLAYQQFKSDADDFARSGGSPSYHCTPPGSSGCIICVG